MTGLMPGGSAGTSFCSGTEMSISVRAMALPSFFVLCRGLLSFPTTPFAAPHRVLRQREHPGPELLLLRGRVDIVFAREGKLAVATDAVHDDGGGQRHDVLSFPHGNRPDRSRDENP